MSEDPIRHYLSLLDVFEIHTNRVQEMINHIQDGASKLHHWDNVIIANIGVSFPIGCQYDINADHWPNAQKLAETLAAWHSAHHELDNAWRRIPAHDRANLRPPPEPK